jgi:atlastin
MKLEPRAQHFGILPVTEDNIVGRPIQIAARRDDHSFKFNKDVLASVLLQDHVKDKNMAVISVVGAFTKGKSLLFEFLL